MKVRDFMQTSVFTVSPDDLIDRVFFLLHYEKIRHLPVVDGKATVIGMVSDRDLYKALGPKSRSKAVTKADTPGEQTQLHVIPRKVRHIMRRGVITVTPDEAAAEAAMTMARKKIGALPVIENDKLVGIVTATDILLEFAKIVSKMD
jgi:acetoin utilization protein AcuB